MTENDHRLLTLTSGIVSAFITKNETSANQLPDIIMHVYTGLTNTQKAPEPEVIPQEPAVSIRSSVKPDYIVCLEDGKKLKMLKRHLMTHYNMTPAEYRAKWNLPADYPMTAPNYAATRAELAKKIGLGMKNRTQTPTPAPTPVADPTEVTNTPTVEVASATE